MSDEVEVYVPLSFFLDETTAHYEGHEADLRAILAAAGR